jgi:hypothetical protein
VGVRVRDSLHYGPRSCPMSDGIFPWSHSHGKNFEIMQILKSLGPLTRCKPNVDQEEWPCLCFFVFYHMPKKGNFEVFREFFTFSPSFLLSTVTFAKENINNDRKNYIKTAFLYHGCMSIVAREPILPFSPQNLLDHDSG